MINTQQTLRRLILCFGLALTGLLPGCQIIGGLYSVLIDPLIPPKIIEAEHAMHNKIVLIWVDDPQVDSQYVLLRRTLTEQLQKELLTKEAVAEVVDYENIARFRVTHPDYAQMSIEELGKTFHADEVLYVFVNDFTWKHEAGKGFYHPELNGYFKVVDAQGNGKRLWPKDRTHQVCHYKGQIEEGRGQTFEKNLLKAFSQTIAKQMALHFYEHPEKKR